MNDAFLYYQSKLLCVFLAPKFFANDFEQRWQANIESRIKNIPIESETVLKESLVTVLHQVNCLVDDRLSLFFYMSLHVLYMFSVSFDRIKEGDEVRLKSKPD